MKFLAVHPGPLMYTKIYLRLEPLGLEMVAQAVRQAGHEVRLIDLQADTWKDYEALIRSWKPDAVAFGCNYLANVPEIVDLANLRRKSCPTVSSSSVAIVPHLWRRTFWNTATAPSIASSRAKGRLLLLNCSWRLNRIARRSPKSRGW